MKPISHAMATVRRWIGGLLLALGFIAGVLVLLLWLAGKFEKKISAEGHPTQNAAQIEGQVVAVRRIVVPMTETAVGSVRAVHETSIGSKLLARIIEANVKAGQKVKAGDVLFRLDDTDLKAKLQQAKAAVEATEAMVVQAEGDAKRAEQLLPERAISQQDYDKAMSMLRSSNADRDRAREAIKEVQATLDWATVRSPLDGLVIDKKVDVGDMVSPGQILATLYDPDRMQIVASVRDSLVGKLEVGQSIGVQVEGFGKRCSGTVSEIVPESQTASRSFQVKVTGPCPPGIHAGVFGRIYIPIREEQVLAIPKNAVRNVGQLELVDVVENGQVTTRAIRCGRPLGADEVDVEILSGLREGEKVVVSSNSIPAQEASHD
jgi:RND family efflux transporter MFP subunit